MSDYRIEHEWFVRGRGLTAEDEAREVTALIRSAPEPFLIPDVTPSGWSPSLVFHIVRDLVDAGALSHSDDGYRRHVASLAAGRSQT